jgi:hypothetical protein
MKTEQKANLARIREEKSKADASTPLEPLIMSLIKGFVDDADLSSKLQELYRVYVIIFYSIILFYSHTCRRRRPVHQAPGAQ